ncbi:MAG: hypothetical protein ACXWUG_31550 [Polyangiales bacterium]
MTDEKKGFRRNDRAGHLDPKHAESLRQKARENNPKDEDKAFVDGHKSRDGLAEELAEEAVQAMTSGEDKLTDDLSANVPEDVGGPFVTTTAGVEMAEGTDASNPRSATREPFPKT